MAAIAAGVKPRSTGSVQRATAWSEETCLNAGAGATTGVLTTGVQPLPEICCVVADRSRQSSAAADFDTTASLCWQQSPGFGALCPSGSPANSFRSASQKNLNPPFAHTHPVLGHPTQKARIATTQIKAAENGERRRIMALHSLRVLPHWSSRGARHVVLYRLPGRPAVSIEAARCQQRHDSSMHQFPAKL